MTSPVWKQLTEVEPGLYWYCGVEPTSHSAALLVVTETRTTMTPRWYARIGDIPPEPVMAQPSLKAGDKVLVRDFDNCRWLRRHFASWADDGLIETWCDGSWWAGEGQKIRWKYWKLPESE